MKFKLTFVALTAMLITSSNVFSQSNWIAEPTENKRFVENLGQFDQFQNQYTGEIKYAIDFGFSRIFFGEKGVSYTFHEVTKKSRAEREEIKNQPARSFQDHKQKEALLGKFLIRDDQVNMSWLNLNENVTIEGIGRSYDYCSYSYIKDGKTIGANYAYNFNQIVYKEILPNIDLEFDVHPIVGVKYAFIVRPGGNPADITALYDRNFKLEGGKVILPTLFGDIIDHEPLTFYENDKNTVIPSSYSLKGSNLGFEIGTYDSNRTIVIDPWVQTPNDPNSNWDNAWELDVDAAGNVYVIQGILPMRLLKYNSAGALQWTHVTPYDTTGWLGTMATDDLGNTYISNGVDYQMRKVDVNGNLVWNNANPSGGQLSTEFWNITFNCDQTRMLVGGTGGNLNIHGKIYDVDMNSGNINSQVQVSAPGNLFAIPIELQEVRAMTSAPNGKYYFLTLDTIGYITDNLTLCPIGTTSLLRDDHNVGWGYKCENWRYNNTGIKAIRADENFVYVHRGNQLQKRSLTDFSIIATAPIPNGNLAGVFLGGNQSQNAGIDIDDCGNVYVGSKNNVYKFDSNLTQIGQFTTTFNVYDLRVNTGGEIVVCGGTGTSNDNNRSGFVQTFAATACAPLALTCCNASVCVPDDVCESSPAFPLVPAQSGGTWSGPGVNGSGIFDPALAGPGTHSITYSLVCGSETISITVDPCATLEVCEESNGNLTVSGGNGTYTWYEASSITASSPITNEAQCISCAAATPQYVGFPPFQIYTGCDISTCPPDTVWTQFGTGATVGAPSSYPIYVEDAFGAITYINNAGVLVACSADPCASITLNLVINLQEDVSCNGGSDGSATISATGGSAPYSFAWNPGSLSGTTQNSLSAGVYLIAIQDDLGCTGSGTLTIGEPSPLVASASGSNATCGANDGSATASQTGGTGPYTYLWSPSGGSSATATNLAPGAYTVTITDALGCSDDASVTISTTNGPTISVDDIQNISCFGDDDGSATVSASGGTPGYTYNWQPGNLSGAIQNNLGPATYTVEVEDASGCIDFTTITINEPAELVVTLGSIQPADCGSSNGEASVSVSGGSGPYSYSWSPSGGTGSSAAGLSGGSYNVTVTDDNLCSVVFPLIIPTSGGPTISVDVVEDVSCFGATDGSATISATGGLTPYTYDWSPSGGSAATATGLSAGTYTVSVIGNDGCISTESITIGGPSELVVDGTVTDENCGQSDGAIAVSISGGSGPYSYDWNPNGETTSSISNLTFGSYTVTVTDGAGCEVSESFVVNQIGSIPVTASPEYSTIVAGDEVQLTASGADNYIWTPVSGLSCSDCPDPIASPLVTTTYIVTGTDASGCSGSDTVIIFVEIDCAELFVPTIFSPNGSGPAANELLCVHGNCISELTFRIFNRWGEVVFESETPIGGSQSANSTICWDGEFRGKPVQSGTYVYTIYARLFDDTIVEDSGNLTVVR
jgi:hypothetical protein